MSDKEVKMTVYQNSSANLGVRLEITHASPDIANNRTTITYKASVYKTGSHNPYNLLSQTPMYLTINGQSLYSTSSGNYDLRGSKYEQTIKSGTLVIPHNSDGSKSFSFSWNVNFTSTGYGYGNVTTSGTYALPNIARASTFTIPSTTITTGSAFTVSISRSSTSFTHRVSYIVGGNETRWTSNATTSYAATVPHSLFHSYRSSSSVSGVIRVTTMNGSSVVGSSQRSVTINLSSGAVPTLASVSYSNSNRGMFTTDNQFIRGISRPTAKAGTASGSYSSTISSYEYRIMRGSNAMSAVSRTTRSYQFPAFSFPNSGSENGVYIQMRVRDSRGRYSSWVNSPEIRVHYYTPPAIGTMTVRRVGSANTTLQVTRNYSVTSMFQSGGGSNLNNAVLRFQHRVKGSSTATNNSGAGSSTTSLSNSNANLSGTFATGTSYEVRAILSDKINTVYGSWISVGTEFVPMDIAPKGVGVGRIHDNGGYNLQVGSGGVKTDGHLLGMSGAEIRGALVVNSGNIHVNGVAQEFHKRTIGDTDPSILATSGASRISSGHTSLPPGSSWSQMLTIYGGADTISQMVFPYSNTGNPWVRSGNPPEVDGKGSYGPWRQLAFTSDIPSIPAIPPSGAATTGAVSGRGRWFQTGDLLICTQVAFISGFFSAYSLTGSWTYPKAFAEAPFVQVAGGHDGMSDNTYRMNGALNAYNVTSTGTSVHFAGGTFSSGNSKRVYMLAIGRP